MSFSLTNSSSTLSAALSQTNRSGVQHAKHPGNDECVMVASEILIAASEAWRYHYRRRAVVIAAVEKQVSKRNDRMGAGGDNLFMFRDDEEPAPAPQASHGSRTDTAASAHTPPHLAVSCETPVTTGPEILEPPVRYNSTSGASDDDPLGKVSSKKKALRSVTPLPQPPAAPRDPATPQASRAAAKTTNKGGPTQSALVINALLETHYHYHREMQQLLHVRGRRVAKIMTSAGASDDRKSRGRNAQSGGILGVGAFGQDSILPFGFSNHYGSNVYARTEVEDPLSDKVLVHYHELAVALVTKHLPSLYEGREYKNDPHDLSRRSLPSVEVGEGHAGSASRSDSEENSNSSNSFQHGTPLATPRSTGVHQRAHQHHTNEPHSCGTSSGFVAEEPTVENLLSISNVLPGLAKLHRSKSKHVIDLEHCVFIRLWRSRSDARSFHRGLAALHEAKTVLMLPPSFAVPYSVLLKGPSNTAVSVTWLPPLESSNVLNPPPLAYTNFTNFFRKAWREAVYPNTPESKLTTVSLCTGADGTYYAMNCGVDDALTGQGAGGIVVDDDMIRSPLRSGSVSSPGSRKKALVVPLMDARRALIDPASNRHYQQCKSIFQRVAQQLKQSYSTQLMFLSMMSYLQGALYTSGAKTLGTGAKSVEGIDTAVESVLEFAASLSKEETPLALSLYAACGEISRLSTTDYVKRMTKKLINTTIFQPKVEQWRMDTRVLSDISATLVTHILEGRDDPIALRRSLETKAIANVAVTDICTVWGMNLADAQTRYGHSRTLQLFTKASLEIVLVDHQHHYIPVLGVQPPKPLAENATSDDSPVAAEVAEIAYGILQSLLLGVDARRLHFAQPDDSQTLSAATVPNVMADGGAYPSGHRAECALLAEKFPLPQQQLKAGTVAIVPGERVVDALQLGGWALCYISPLMHEPQRNNMFHLARVCRLLRFERDEGSRLLAKAIAILVCANVSSRNFFDTILIKRILQVGIEVIRGRCADKELLRDQLRFLEGTSVARHRELLVEDIDGWLKASLAREQAYFAEQEAANQQRVDELERQRALDAHRLANGEPDYVFDPSKLARKGQTESKRAAPSISTVKEVLRPMKSLHRRIYQFLIETIIDPVPQVATTDDLLMKPYEPVGRPAPQLPSISGRPSEPMDDEWEEGANVPGFMRARKSTDPAQRLTKHGRSVSKTDRGKVKLSKFDVFFRTVALYREEEHGRGEIDRLATLHAANLEVRFANGARVIERRLWLRQHITDGYISSDDEESPKKEGGAMMHSAPKETVKTPLGLRGEGLMKWRKERRAEKRERRRRDQLECQAVTGKARRYRKTMQEMFPGAPDVYSKAEVSWPLREMPSIRFALGAFVLQEAERQGRAQCLLNEFEEFSAAMIAFDSELWDI